MLGNAFQDDRFPEFISCPGYEGIEVLPLEGFDDGSRFSDAGSLHFQKHREFRTGKIMRFHGFCSLRSVFLG